MAQETTLMKIFLIFSTFVGFAFATTVAQVEADITSMIALATTYDKAISALSATNPSLINVLAIHTDANNLTTSLNQLTTDFKSLPLPVNEDDVIAIIDNISDYVPIITDALSGIIFKKSAFASAPIGGIPALILQDLISLNSSNSNLETAILTTFPGLNCHTTAVDAAFTNAIAAFTD